MSLIHSVMWSIHVGFAILWTGSVLFVTAAVLPPATRGEIGAEALTYVVGRLRWITRISAVAFVVSGGHMAGNVYTVETLTGTGSGHLVLTMIALWLVITGLVEAAGGTVVGGLDAGTPGEAAREAKTLFYVATALSVVLIATAGLLANPFGV
ncbi:hypothetical protein JCM18237_09050 [Halorubrum luteum]